MMSLQEQLPPPPLSPPPPSTLALPCFDGVFLSKQENEFVHDVMDELQTYQQKNNCKSILLFPPLPSRLRYLIHKTIENVPELSTFSVGEGCCRRVVVCYSELRRELEEDSDLESNNSLCEEPESFGEEIEAQVRPKTAAPPPPLPRRGPKRPDKPLYMPRAARDRLSSRNPPAEQQEPSSAPSGGNSIRASSDSCGRLEKTKDSSALETAPRSADGVRDSVADDAELCPLEQKDEVTSRQREDEALVLEQTRSSFAEMTVGEDEKGKEDPAGDHGNTDDTRIDTDDVTEEIRTHLKDALTVSIQHVHKDYSLYENISVSLDGFGHVIEIYDFPAVFKTEDLLDAFAEYSEGGMKIKWVDNTHALGVFSSEAAALHALSIGHPMLKARPLAEGSKKAQGKALRRAEFIQPVKERPRTDSAVARRMVTRALGLRGRGRRQLC